MKKQFNKIEFPQSLNQIFPIKVRFENSDVVYDFGKYFDSDIARTFAKVFYERYSKLSMSTSMSVFFSCNKFFLYLKEINILFFKEFDKKYLISFAISLDKEKLSLSSKYKIYQQIETIFKDIIKINEFDLNFKIPANPYRNINKDKKTPKIITSEQLKKIISICAKNVDLIINEFRITEQKLLELDEIKNYKIDTKNIYHIVHFFYKKYGYVPNTRLISASERLYIEKAGGVDEINRRLCPNAYTLLPFYILLLIDLAGNSDAIRQIKLDCIIEDPLFEDRCFIIWDKSRANNEQKRNVIKNKKYGAYKLIELVKELTKNTRKQVDLIYKEYLFIIRGENENNNFSIPAKSRFNQEINKFIKDNNIDFSFNPSDIRPTILTEIYKGRKDIVSVSKIANHKSVNTTLSYIVNEETKKENRQYLSEKQSKFISDIVKVDKLNENIDIDINVAENMGFYCKNPIIDKKVCVNWMAELTNPDLIIPSSAEYLAKIIALKKSILKAEKLMNKERFILLYNQVLDLINNQILPKFSKELIKESEILAKGIIVPLLEGY